MKAQLKSADTRRPALQFTILAYFVTVIVLRLVSMTALTAFNV
jgi:hypothetical protein